MPTENDAISKNKIAIVRGGSRGIGRNTRQTRHRLGRYDQRICRKPGTSASTTSAGTGGLLLGKRVGIPLLGDALRSRL
jgi:hypothetical protein